MKSFWVKVAVLAGPLLFWGALVTYVNGLHRNAGQLPSEDAALFGFMLAIGILALGFSVRKSFSSALTQVCVMLCALAASLAVAIAHWGGISFYLLMGAATFGLVWVIIQRVKS